MAAYRFRGSVIDENTSQGLPNLLVQAWDKDPGSNDLLGTATTNEQGHFVIEFDDAAFSDQGNDRHPDIFVKIFSGETLLHSTETQPIVDWTPQHSLLVSAATWKCMNIVGLKMLHFLPESVM